MMSSMFLHRELVLDFRDDARLAVVLLQDLAQLVHVAPCSRQKLSATKSTCISAPSRDVGEILLRERRQIHPHAGQIDVPARAHHAGA